MHQSGASRYRALHKDAPICRSILQARKVKSLLRVDSLHRSFLPDRVDLSDQFPAPGDQGEQNSCVG
jgi:hypothetical protein